MIHPLHPWEWPLTLEDLPPKTYLVGGSVRDGLRGVLAADLDLDFVTPGPAIPLAQQLAKKYRASFVILDARREIARIVFPQATVDFAQQVGGSLRTDLQRRDFTINAIAYDPRSDEIIDPLQGQMDLNARQIRMIALENLAADPLRVLRAYRQASQLQFAITPETRHGLKAIAPDLSQVAPERIRTELSYLLACPESQRYLHWAWADRVLVDWLPQLDPTGLARLQRLEAWLTAGCPLAQSLVSFLHKPLLTQPGPGEPRKRTLLNLTKLSCLLDAPSDPGLIQGTLSHLTYSNREIKLIQTLLKTLAQLPAALPPQARLEQFFLFRHVGAAWPGLVLLGIATGISENSLAQLTQAWLDPEHPLAHPPCLITGADLIQDFALQPGPEIGVILQQIELAQAKGELTTTAAARAWVTHYLENRDEKHNI